MIIVLAIVAAIVIVPMLVGLLRALAVLAIVASFLLIALHAAAAVITSYRDTMVAARRASLYAHGHHLEALVAGVLFTALAFVAVVGLYVAFRLVCRTIVHVRPHLERRLAALRMRRAAGALRRARRPVTVNGLSRAARVDRERALAYITSHHARTMPAV